MKRTLALGLTLLQGTAAFAVLNGEAVNFSDHPHTVLVRSSAGVTSGAVVGPRVVLTATFGIGKAQTVEIDGRVYPVITAATDKLPGGDAYGLAALATGEALEGVTPLHVGGQGPQVGESLQMFGYGATSSSVSAAPTSFLSLGSVAVESWIQQLAFVMKSEDDVAAYFGDGGGPVVRSSEARLELLGLIALSNVRDTTYVTNVTAHRKFLYDFAKKNAVVICGIVGQPCGSEE